MITVSISTFTVACFVVLAMGAKVGKHLNRLDDERSISAAVQKTTK